MIKLILRPTRKLCLATSGGVDSMAAYNFLSRNHQVTPVFFNHGTENSAKAEEFIKENTLNPIIGKIARKKAKDESWEEYWRNERYAFFKHLRSTSLLPVITAHHLDDVVETWIFSAIHGTPKLVAAKNGIVHRPFLLTRKSDFVKWAENHGVKYIFDTSNEDNSKMRNHIRNNMMKDILKVNPGIHKTIAKKIADLTRKS